MNSILQVNQVYKYFGGVKANKNISMTVDRINKYLGGIGFRECQWLILWAIHRIGRDGIVEYGQR